MGELSLYSVVAPTLLIQQRGRHAAEAMARHLFLGVAEAP
jgi:hypothetical protein